jgi:hypothetical protein
LTNVIAFGLWYWELDRGGPVSRAQARRTLPDFQFVQMDHPALAHEDWRVEVGDAPQAGCARVVGTVAAAPGGPRRR